MTISWILNYRVRFTHKSVQHVDMGAKVAKAPHRFFTKCNMHVGERGKRRERRERKKRDIRYYKV